MTKSKIIFSKEALKYRGYQTSMRLLSPVGYITAEYSILDVITNKIWALLKERNWNVPGITVEFDLYGDNQEEYQKVWSIEGDDFLLRFGRIIGSLGQRFNNTAGCTSIVIPNIELRYYNDFSGGLNYYIGGDWNTDRERFKHCSKINSKLSGDDKWYLKYSLSESKVRNYTYQGHLASYFVANNDLGREYDPEGDEPQFFVVKEMYQRIATWLEKNVVSLIESVPKADEYIDPFSVQETQKAIPMPDIEFPKFYVGIKEHVVELKKQSQNASVPISCYTNGFLAFVNNKEGVEIPDILYGGGYVFGGIAMNEKLETIEDVQFGEWYKPCSYLSHESNYIPSLVKPKVANDVYIFDAELAEIKRAEIIANLGTRDRLTDQEVTDFKLASALSLVPIAEYKGGYGKPVIAIRRKLSLDEIELVGVFAN